jgi:hypothetical protein
VSGESAIHLPLYRHIVSCINDYSQIDASQLVRTDALAMGTSMFLDLTGVLIPVSHREEPLGAKKCLV